MHDCSFCPGNKATCHLTKVINGKVVEVHVCEKCIPEATEQNLVDFDIWGAISKLAKDKGVADPAEALEIQEDEEISAKSLLMPASVPSTAECPACGFSAEDLKKTGRLGCPECYGTFAEMLTDVFNDCQKGPDHTGKVPHAFVSLKKERIQLELEKAVEEERFEEAALLRDQLNELNSGAAE